MPLSRSLARLPNSNRFFADLVGVPNFLVPLILQRALQIVLILKYFDLNNYSQSGASFFFTRFKRRKVVLFFVAVACAGRNFLVINLLDLLFDDLIFVLFLGKVSVNVFLKFFEVVRLG